MCFSAYMFVRLRSECRGGGVLSWRCSKVGCRSRRYGGSRLLIKCQTKQKSTSVFFSGNRPAICSSFIHSLRCLLSVCVDVCECVCMCKHSSQQPLGIQVYNVTDVVVRNQQLGVWWLSHVTVVACDWPGRGAKKAWRNPGTWVSGEWPQPSG